MRLSLYCRSLDKIMRLSIYCRSFKSYIKIVMVFIIIHIFSFLYKYSQEKNIVKFDSNNEEILSYHIGIICLTFHFHNWNFPCDEIISIEHEAELSQIIVISIDPETSDENDFINVIKLDNIIYRHVKKLKEVRTVLSMLLEENLFTHINNWLLITTRTSVSFNNLVNFIGNYNHKNNETLLIKGKRTNYEYHSICLFDDGIFVHTDLLIHLLQKNKIREIEIDGFKYAGFDGDECDSEPKFGKDNFDQKSYIIEKTVTFNFKNRNDRENFVEEYSKFYREKIDNFYMQIYTKNGIQIDGKFVFSQPIKLSTLSLDSIWKKVDLKNKVYFDEEWSIKPLEDELYKNIVTILEDKLMIKNDKIQEADVLFQILENNDIVYSVIYNGVKSTLYVPLLDIPITNPTIYKTPDYKSIKFNIYYYITTYDKVVLNEFLKSFTRSIKLTSLIIAVPTVELENLIEEDIPKFKKIHKLHMELKVIKEINDIYTKNIDKHLLIAIIQNGWLISDNLVQRCRSLSIYSNQVYFPIGLMKYNSDLLDFLKSLDQKKYGHQFSNLNIHDFIDKRNFAWFPYEYVEDTSNLLNSNVCGFVGDLMLIESMSDRNNNIKKIKSYDPDLIQFDHKVQFSAKKKITNYMGYIANMHLNPNQWAQLYVFLTGKTFIN